MPMTSTPSNTSFNVVAINETDFLSEELIKKCGEYFTLYVYNPREVTYCCEMSPSYYLMAVGALTKKRLSDDAYAEIGAELHNYSHYRYCSSVKNLKSVAIGDFDTIEEAAEYATANSSLFENLPFSNTEQNGE